MAINLGFIPLDVQVTLAWGGEFLQTLNADDPWPAGVEIELRFSTGEDAVPIVWPATIDGLNARWAQSVASVASVIDGGARTVRLHYIDPSGGDIVWGKGRTRVV